MGHAIDLQATFFNFIGAIKISLFLIFWIDQGDLTPYIDVWVIKYSVCLYAWMDTQMEKMPFCTQYNVMA